MCADDGVTDNRDKFWCNWFGMDLSFVWLGYFGILGYALMGNKP